MTTEQKKNVARRFFDGFNTGNLSNVEEYIAPSFKGYGPGTPPNTTGPEGYRRLATAYRTAFPDLQVTLDDLVAEGDKVAVRWTARGTQRGELLGIPPTGKVGTATGMHSFRIANGKIEEAWVEWDMLGTLQQLGVIPAPGQTQRLAA